MDAPAPYYSAGAVLRKWTMNGMLISPANTSAVGWAIWIPGSPSRGTQISSMGMVTAPERIRERTEEIVGCWML